MRILVRNLKEVEREILMSGVDDWVDMPEGMYFAYQIIGNDVSESEALSIVIAAVKNLLRQGLVEVGEVAGGFNPWTGSLDELEKRIDQAQEQAVFPILFGDLFWVGNTPQGHIQGERLLQQEAQSNPKGTTETENFRP